MTTPATRRSKPTIKELDVILDEAGRLVDAYLATDAEARSGSTGTLPTGGNI